MKTAVVTGYALASPLGNDPAEFKRRMFAGESGVRTLGPMLAGADFPVAAAGLIEGLNFPPLNARQYRLETEIILEHLISDYVRRHGIFEPVDGFIYGTNEAAAPLQDIHRFHSAPNGEYAAGPSFEHGLNFVLGRLNRQGHPAIAKQNTLCHSNTCATGLVAIGYAIQRVELGESKRILVICNESRVRPEDLLRFHALGALSRQGGDPAKISRPFTKSRSGFVKGEGAGLMIIEEKSHAEKRGAKILAALPGAALTSDAYRLTDGREDASGIIGAMNLATKRARLSPGDIDYFNAHGTSTYKNDLVETTALKEYFGARSANLPVSSLKSQIGHLNYACGIVEAIACVMMLEEQRIAPTLNQDDPDPVCDLDFVPNESRRANLRHIMKNNYGFGGANACLILSAVSRPR